MRFIIRIGKSIAINTTVFLSSVALYYSADRPQGKSLTIIDKYFVLFYSIVFLKILTEFIFFLNQNIYQEIIKAWKIITPIAALLMIIFTFYKMVYRVKKTYVKPN